MAEFNVHKWFKNQYLQEDFNLDVGKEDDPKIGAELEAGLGGTGVAEGEGHEINLYPAISSVIPEDTSYVDFAKAVAQVLIEDYGSHNFGKFMEVLHSELGMNESLKEGAEGDLQAQINTKFPDQRLYVSMYGNSGKLQFHIKDDIEPGYFSEVINFIESLGYKVNRDQSDNLFDWDDDRYYYPRIIFSK